MNVASVDRAGEKKVASGSRRMPLRSPRMIVGVLSCFCAVAAGSSAHGEDPPKPTAPATESRPAVPAAGHSLHGEAFDEGPRQAAHLMPGMGVVNFPVSTRKPEAQAFLNQGVAQIHSFFYYEAERSFRQASRIDPDCGMAYWGMALANVNNSRRARSFLKEARKREGSLTRREKLYLDALDALHKEGGGGEKARKLSHLKALGTVAHEFPDDLNARAWLAMMNWEAENTNSRETIDILIDGLLQAEPNHPGAHHYRIHLWDGANASYALNSAALYGQLAPGIAHAWHMPGHTYTSLNRFADAAFQQEASARVDHAYMTRDRVMPFEIHNYAHNNQWLVTSLSHVGRARDAVKVARNLVEQPRDPKKNGKTDGGSAQRNGRLRWSEVLCRYELWDDLIAATESNALDWSDLVEERRQKAYTLGLAYAGRNEPNHLSEQINALKSIAAEEKKPKRDRETDSPLLAELEGYQHLARGEFKTAFERFAKAPSMRPEALARARLVAKNPDVAEKVARDAVNAHPGQVPPLAALVETLNAIGKTHEAKEAYRKLAPLARSADPDLPVFQRLAPVVAAWRAEPSWVEPTEPTTTETKPIRPDPNTLGPLVWSPFAAEAIAANDSDGKTWHLADQKGKNVLILFYLGGSCAPCMQQLRAFGKEIDAFKAINTEVVAVSTDDQSATTQLKNNADGISFPMPLLADPSLDLFKRYHAFDDFEGVPLHATFLVDALGEVRYQRIAAEPFLDVDFIKGEIQRINRLVKRPDAHSPGTP